MSGSGHLQPSCTVPTDGSLSPDSFRARRMLLTAESGHKRTLALQQGRENPFAYRHDLAALFGGSSTPSGPTNFQGGDCGAGAPLSPALSLLSRGVGLAVLG